MKLSSNIEFQPNEPIRWHHVILHDMMIPMCYFHTTLKISRQSEIRERSSTNVHNSDNGIKTCRN